MEIAAQVLAVFVGAFVLELCSCSYTLAVGNRQKKKAVPLSGLGSLLAAFVVINYTDNWLLVLPMALGEAIGTWASLWLDGKQ